MEKEPLLLSSSSPKSPTSSLRKHFLSASPSFPSPPSPLCPLPEHNEISVPIPSSSSAQSPAASFKDRLIFGDPTNSSENTPLPSSPLSPSWPPPPPPPTTPSPKPNLHRSRTAPAMSAIHCLSHPGDPAAGGGDPKSPSIVRYAFLLLSLYLVLGVVVYSLFSSHFASAATHPVVDALYFCIVTMCTIGYGDITPTTPFSKLFSITFVLFGFGFIDILLSSMVSYVLDLQESLLLSSSTHSATQRRNYLVDVKKGRMRIRMKVGLALAVVFLCIGLGTAVLRFVEALGWLDSFYLSVMSVTTVGYGDRAFKTLPGRLFASVWLLVSTLAVARAFLYLAEARIDKRHRKIAKWVLARDMTVSEFLAADMDHNGFVR